MSIGYCAPSAGIFDVPERSLWKFAGPMRRVFSIMFSPALSVHMAVNRGRYGLMCHAGGGIACDGVVFRLAEDWFWYVHADRDVLTWLHALKSGSDVQIRDPGAWAIQIQGPTSLEILDACVDGGAPERVQILPRTPGHYGRPASTDQPNGLDWRTGI